MKISIFGLSDVGKLREINEDSFLISGFENESLFGYALLADGMGGHNAGEVASSTAVNTVKFELDKTLEEKSHDRIIYNILGSIDYANKKIYDLSISDINKAGMGSTFVLSYIVDDNLYIANIGDSRAYLINKDECSQITVDHSVVQRLVDLGSITPEEASVHPDKNIITRALGTEEYVEADLFEYKLKVGDYIFLCSDGLYEMVDKETFSNIILNSDNIELAVNKLIELANENGGRDNITVIVIKCFE